ncbi:acyltransferase family protein [Actinomadura sp. HBU206391]|uniref:acyltransferase family protein n=1 Tax=Actinomadura sp. HBU206391 TaxID=2731692 RepID=UPI00164F97E0|nr:acyltransferase [Actinomadura sp. HBU206391]MBC6457342.1 acyltransferase [Actinomadura sp. HBU206391]
MTLGLTPARRCRVAALAGRIEAATPEHRDRAVDALRAIAILGVVLGHWTVTALVAGEPIGGNGATRLHAESPLSSMPAFIPVSWALQTLAVFFFVGGYTATRGLRRPYIGWIRVRMLRLSRPVAVLLVAWIPMTLGLITSELPPAPLLKLVLSPLWFLCVYAVLTALTPLLHLLPHRAGPYAAIVPAAVVAAVDLARFGLDGPAWLGWINVIAGWLVPYLLGIAWANGALESRRIAVAMLVTGTAGTAALVAWGGYPASMVGVPGAAISNLNPPTLAAVTFGVAQVGLALLVRDRLARWMRRPMAWAGVALANLSAMTVFCWHQTALMLVTLTGLAAGTLPGLHDAPDGPAWVLCRLAWLPVFALTLAGLWALFHRVERPNARGPRTSA